MLSWKTSEGRQHRPDRRCMHLDRNIDPPHVTASVVYSYEDQTYIYFLPFAPNFVISEASAGPPSASLSDNNGTKDLRNRNKDDVFVTVRDRKVRSSDDASLYTLCRSWLKNGFPEETQPPYLDAARPLPRPLPVGSEHQLVDSTDKKDGDKEVDDERRVTTRAPDSK